MLARYYDEVLGFTRTLIEAGYTETARVIDDAVRGGATSGEILTYVALALSRFLGERATAHDAVRAEAARLLEIADEALRSPGKRIVI